jgi:integrase
MNVNASEDDIERFETRWPLGSRERIAFDVLLYTGLRRGDAVKLGRQHVRDGVFRIKTAEHVSSDPSRDVAMLKVKTNGFPAWRRRNRFDH